MFNRLILRELRRALTREWEGGDSRAARIGRLEKHGRASDENLALLRANRANVEKLTPESASLTVGSEQGEVERDTLAAHIY